MAFSRGNKLRLPEADIGAQPRNRPKQSEDSRISPASADPQRREHAVMDLRFLF